MHCVLARDVLVSTTRAPHGCHAQMRRAVNQIISCVRHERCRSHLFTSLGAFACNLVTVRTLIVTRLRDELSRGVCPKVLLGVPFGCLPWLRANWNVLGVSSECGRVLVKF